MPSFEPISGTISLSGSKRRPNRLSIHATIALAKRHETESETIAAHRRSVRRLVQRFQRARRRREIGVARAKVDDVDAARNELALLLRDRRERILGKRLKSTSELRH